jgi:tetratricopeptide (TPR) repeat protein
VHVGELVMTLDDRQRPDVTYVGADHGDRAGRPSELDRIDNDERIRAIEQLVHEMHSADPDVQHADFGREGLGEQPVCDDDAEPVVAAKDVAHARDENTHVLQHRETMTTTDPALEELEERLARYPPDRYPIQHATAQFHLGLALTNLGELEGAETALVTAARLFDPERLRVEHAKALNALGATIRLAGRPEEAAEAFRRAAESFAAAAQPLEQGAASFNLGLVRRELGELEAAIEALEQARGLLNPDRVPERAASAARELGATLLSAGALDPAIEALEDAVAFADRAGDYVERGAATNVLGLARLAKGEATQAIEDFRQAAVSHPRSVRPHDFAMAKANVALAYERAGDAARARLAALQALGVPGSPKPVADQAAGVLERIGPACDDLFVVLDDELRDRWLSIVREEIVRWTDASPDERRREAAAWIHGQLAREGTAEDLAAAWLGALLELPPPKMESIIRSALEALGEQGRVFRDRFRSQVVSAMARFHPPQWIRLKDTFNRIAGELGQEPDWN